MSFLLDSIPYFHCLVRKEYTRNLVDGHGKYLKAVAVAAWCRRGSMLGFQTVFTGEDAQGKEVPTGGAMFAQLPIRALCWKPCDEPADIDAIAPWDVFSETFTVAPIQFLKGIRAVVMPGGFPGRYLFSLDFCASDLADDPGQHKQLHIVKVDDGWFAAVPNNRLLLEDRAFWKTAAARPEFTELAQHFSAE
jgi:hypothetical protein